MRIGKVVSVNSEKGYCRVNYFEDNQTSIELPIIDNIYKMPKVNDLVLIAPLSGAKGVIVGSFFNEKNAPKQNGGIRIELNDNAYISIDKNGNITIKGNKITIDGTLMNNTINMTNHKHTDSQGGTTSTPQ